jgi:hypothetical protein
VAEWQRCREWSEVGQKSVNQCPETGVSSTLAPSSPKSAEAGDVSSYCRISGGSLRSRLIMMMMMMMRLFLSIDQLLNAQARLVMLAYRKCKLPPLLPMTLFIRLSFDNGVSHKVLRPTLVQILQGSQRIIPDVVVR